MSIKLEFSRSFIDGNGASDYVNAEVTPLLAFEVSDLTVAYSNKSVLSRVNLNIPKGAITALIGPSGCGKTSFLNCLNRMVDLISGCSVTGRINYNSQNILEERHDVIELRRRVGMVFQRPNPFPTTIKRNLEIALYQAGFRGAEETHASMEVQLRRVGLWEEVKHDLNKPATRLSGGQQQRLCIARALCLSPDVLLMDEPCSALDPLSSAKVEELIASLKEQCTIVIVTHNLAQARRISDHCVMFWMNGVSGQIVESGATESLFSKPQHVVTASYISGALA
ncbi:MULTISPECIES: phosphate ABC transporter ATP-binding protein [unclassified Pseudomonas]|uniref:phosphate ABC transporter ATP-binding protein n=1 Tax=unclassified Pseudomonas TaxID=196821 RepID=UPI00119BCBE8|nr:MULTISPECIES: phosphate ABC transporter ATP-binding protein [unclassified Pseudomonas]TWC11114.1 phosphate ABC transporter ATP-binding protein (PhoT family) [Pseudomonas sp. SJZ074]TWC18925.1 phosphate ABC transporter ATP-binding protein (PhoT family) [Pseudomonas sp. SJZ075]TWC29575.1 phosphate ABC transporter ATP-binding protein (PhoT family) [Pseudomonas sp. SJZ085]TWC33361.1 phosphate ABC transporter ATP-binding protein (PhoT family) [Pseudomonas sp. SJZ078]TWC55881.1 phosphate ABC tran